MSTFARDDTPEVIHIRPRGAGYFRSASQEEIDELIRLEMEAKQEDLGRMRIFLWVIIALIFYLVVGGLIWYFW